MKNSSTGAAWRAAPLLMSGALMVGCVTAPPSSTRTTVVLLPDADNKVGAVLISAAAGTQTLDQAFSYTTVAGPNAAPSKASMMEPEAVQRVYGSLLGLQRPKPLTFTLHFLFDNTELTEESRASLPALFEAVRARKPGKITIFGHADATGSGARNLNLSSFRAQAAAHLLRANDPSLDNIEVQFFGDTRPLTQPDPRTPETRDRRVEILID